MSRRYHPPRVPKNKCPQAGNHTPSPMLYLEWHEWAAKMSETHDQTKCPGCGLWLIWVSKSHN